MWTTIHSPFITLLTIPIIFASLLNFGNGSVDELKSAKILTCPKMTNPVECFCSVEHNEWAFLDEPPYAGSNFSSAPDNGTINMNYVIYCSRLTDENQLTEALQAFADDSAPIELYLIDNLFQDGFGSPRGASISVWERINVKYLHLMHNDIRSYSQELFRILGDKVVVFTVDDLIGNNASDSQLLTAIKRLSGLRAVALKLASVTNLTSTTLEPLSETVNTLTIHNQGIMTIADDAFSHTPNLYGLQLFVDIPTLPMAALSTLTHLRNFTFSSARYTKISESDFRSAWASNLRHLNLETSKIQNIETGAFEKVDKLETLTLNYNRLSFLPTKIWARGNGLKVLELGGNGITRLPKETLEDLTSLNTLNLKNNKLQSTLDADLNFEPLGDNLEHLNLAQNWIDNFPTQISVLKKLKTLDMKRNHLKHIPKEAFKGLYRLEVLNIQYNYLPKFDEDVYLPLKKSLRTLKLDGNGMQGSLSLKIFQDFPRLEHLGISDNNFTRLTSVHTLLESNSTFKTLFLDGNPWVCDCSMVFLAKWPTLWTEEQREAYKRYEYSLQDVTCIYKNHTKPIAISALISNSSTYPMEDDCSTFPGFEAFKHTLPTNPESNPNATGTNDQTHFVILLKQRIEFIMKLRILISVLVVVILMFVITIIYQYMIIRKVKWIQPLQRRLGRVMWNRTITFKSSIDNSRIGIVKERINNDTNHDKNYITLDEAGNYE